MTDQLTVKAAPPCPACRAHIASMIRYPGDSFIWYRCPACGHRWMVHEPETAELRADRAS